MKKYALLVILSMAVPSAAAAQERLEYNRHIRPILTENCFACHGADSAARKARLRLDQREVAIERDAIVPGKPDESGLVSRVFDTDAKRRMPPASTTKHLTPAQKELLKRWVAEGAEYQPHWAFIAPKRLPLPKVHEKTWPQNAIDYFVLARLEKEG